ncbi:MAG: hypothetical protein M3Y51_05845 [Actinomycetota bacterium]|nr:hypothetical protein [Actinomycetota bacterium]
MIVDPAAARLCGETAELVERHRRHGLDIAADGAGSLWSGDRIDWDCFDAAFLNGRLAHDPATADGANPTGLLATEPSPN